MTVLQSQIKPADVVPNIAQMLMRNVERYEDNVVFSTRTPDGYHGITWAQMYRNINNVAAHLTELGFRRSDRMVIFSPNRREMLEMELAVMASGGIAVPIFAHFKIETAGRLMRHCDATFLCVAGASQLENTPSDIPFNAIISFDDVNPDTGHNVIPYRTLLQPSSRSVLLPDAKADEICLNMFTSGTMSTPKCVQLTHGNILSQRAAMERLWSINERDRFLSYLPWHHSFGGIYELFTALYHGATMAHESSSGKNIDLLMENWRLATPTVFFSVPKVYADLVQACRRNKEYEQLVFPERDGLKFIFTAAAPLPPALSQEFERRNIPVMEGWGLTETSPCCTVTDISVQRTKGVVGRPIPGVSLRIAEEGEIQVRGPNVMNGYYKNDLANAEAFTADGWYRTGDVGEFCDGSLRLIARKDRIFKLTNGEKVVPTDMESLIQSKCHYISFAVVEGSGKDYPVALLFPNKHMLEQPEYELSQLGGCTCPRSLNELSSCLNGCLNSANDDLRQKFARVRTAALVDEELSIEKGTLTPSMKVAQGNVLKVYKAVLEDLFEEQKPLRENVYVIELNENTRHEPVKP